MATDIRDCQLQLELYQLNGSSAGGGQVLAEAPVPQVDHAPLAEWAKLQLALRRPRRPFVLDHVGDVVLEPTWHATLGRPYIEGVTVAFPDSEWPSAPVKIPLSFLSEAAKSATVELVQAGRLVEGDSCRFRVCAYPRDTHAASEQAPATGALAVQPVVEPLAVAEASISDFVGRSVVADPQCDHTLAVFVPGRIIDEIHRLTLEAGAVETGGVLIGHLRFDPMIPEICVEVTAQIQAVHARQELTSLTLTPETWAAVSAAVSLRDLGEIYLGWWHSHPLRQWCNDCPAEKRKTCRLRGDFFSAQDIALHRCCFLRAFCVALVVSDDNEHNLTTAMYGWREGTVQRRGFYLLDDG